MATQGHTSCSDHEVQSNLASRTRDRVIISDDRPDGVSVDEIPLLATVPVEGQVIFDLETTGLDNPHILQIGASSPKGTFSTYVLPKRPIHPKASEINGLTFDGQRLLYNDTLVPSVTIRQALSEFLDFLGDQPVTLFAHNAWDFDSVVLLNAVRACDMLSEFQSKVAGFVDTLPLFRKVWPELRSHSLKYLYDRFFSEPCAAHEAMSDVRALQKLLTHSKATTDDFRDHFFSVEDVLHNEDDDDYDDDDDVDDNGDDLYDAGRGGDDNDDGDDGLDDDCVVVDEERCRKRGPHHDDDDKHDNDNDNDNDQMHMTNSKLRRTENSADRNVK